MNFPIKGYNRMPDNLHFSGKLTTHGVPAEVYLKDGNAPATSKEIFRNMGLPYR
jgi:hypothetical protein